MTRGTAPLDHRGEEVRLAGERPPSEPISVRIAEAVRLTGIGRSTIYELISAGQIESFKVGRSRFIPYTALQRLIRR